MNKRIKVTSLTTVALASIILAGTNVNNVKADVTTDNATTAKAQTPEDQAKANVAAAQNDVASAESNVSSASSNLDKAKSDAINPDKAYEDQSKAVDVANNNVETKNNALQDANTKKAEAEKLADEANKPGAIDDAKKAVSDKQNEISDKQQAVKDAQDKIEASQKAIDDAKSDLAAKNTDLTNKQNAKADADQKVTDAENALNNTNFEQVKNNLDNANAAVDKDAENLQSAANEIKTDESNVNTTKDTFSSANTAVTAAETTKDQAQKDYDDKKKQSDSAQSEVDNEDQNLDSLEKQLRDIDELINEQNQNNITIKDLAAYKQAYADYMKNHELTDKDKEYLNSAIKNNKYVSSAKATQEKIDPNNLTTEQIQELSLFTVYLFNQLRQQVGLTPNDVVTEGAINFAKEVTDAYRKDHWSIIDQGNHDCEAINRLADENGLKYNTGNDGVYDKDTQPYENASAVGNVDDSFRNDSNENNDSYPNFAPQTMDDLRRYVYDATNSMIFGSGEQYEFDHARGILGAVADSAEIVAENNQSELQYEINKIKETLSTDENDIPAQPGKEDQGGSIVLELNQAKDNIKRYQEYLNDNQDNPELVNKYKKLIDDTNKLIESLPEKINANKQKLAQLEALSKEDTSYPHYVATDFVYLPHNIEGTDLNAETQVHFLNGMNPSDITDPSKFSTKEIPSYEKQKTSIQAKITESQNTLLALKEKVEKLSANTLAAKTALDDAITDLNSKQTILKTANNNYQAAQKALDEAKQKEKNLQDKQNKDLENQKKAQASFDAFQGTHQQLVTRYNEAVQNQNNAKQAVNNAKTALASAQTALNNAEQAQNNLNKDIANKQQAVKDAQAQLTQLQNHESELEKAPQILAAATAAQEKAQKEYDDAKKQADDAEAALKKLQPAKDEADQKVSEAQSEYDSAVAELSAAQAKLADAKANLERIQNAQVQIDEGHKTSTTKKDNNKSSNKISYKLVRLTHNAFVYDKNGKAIRKGLHFKLIKRGKQIKALNNAKVVTIKGQKFYQLGKNEFVKVNNTKFKTRSAHFKATVKGSGRAYTRAGKYNKYHVSTRKTYTFDEKITVHGKTYYKISWTNNWIPASKLNLKK